MRKENKMDKYDKVCYDLALKYAEIKFKNALDRDVIALLYPNTEPQAEIQALQDFFQDAYLELKTYDYSDFFGDYK
jgi:hypothetical protein